MSCDGLRCLGASEEHRSVDAPISTKFVILPGKNVTTKCGFSSESVAQKGIGRFGAAQDEGKSDLTFEFACMAFC
jgi:hypothetical protein